VDISKPRMTEFVKSVHPSAGLQTRASEEEIYPNL
jgi:hypothetical protein